MSLSCTGTDRLLLQDQRKGGHTTLMACTCVLAHFRMVSHRPFISLKTTPPCQVWFKGMKIIIQEHVLWPEGDLPAQCLGFHCSAGCTDCYCWHILFLQPDFVSQKSQLQELVESCGHLCNFYPKCHCELNFIEQYCGAAKLCFCIAGCMATITEMERKVIQCLDDVPLLHIWQ